MSDPNFPTPLSDDEARARKKRNMIIALCITGFMVLIFVVTLTRLQEGVARKQDWAEEIGKDRLAAPGIESGEGPLPKAEETDE